MKKIFSILFLIATLIGPSKNIAQETSRDKLEALIRAQEANSGVAVTGTPEHPNSVIIPKEIPAQNNSSAPTVEVDIPQIKPGMTIPDSFFERPTPKPPTLRENAFKELLNRVSPLTPDQIIELRKAKDRTERAAKTLPDTPPRPVSSTLTIDLSPGVTPPVIRLGPGFVTSIVFVDSTGQPWPIADYSLGNPKNFNIQWDRKTNIMFMQGSTASVYTTGNLAVRLAKLDTPIMLSLVSGQKEVDYRVDLHVNGRGPHAVAAMIGDNLPPKVDPILLSVLDGVPPSRR